MKKTRLITNSPPERVRSALDRRFTSKEEAALVLQIPLYRIRRACRGDLSGLGSDDWRKISPMLSNEDRDALRAYLLP